MKQDFGAFELRKKIGSGGMASVYLGVQKSLDRQVVLKVLYPHLAEDEKLVARFEREARAAAMMRHENIVQVIDCGRFEELSYIAMEFVEGGDLKKWLESHGAPPIEMALLMLRDILRGIEHAHSHRIIHRDIKPANVMLTPEGAIKIMDFGLARRGAESTSVTVVGTVMGTVAYMSPEQATGEVVDERADIFSAGVVGYELLGGRRPFEGESYSAVLRAVLTIDPPRLETLNPLVPDPVVTLIHRMLHKDVSKRYPNVQQVREDLETVIEDMGLHRARDLLRDYAKDPQAVDAKLRKKHLSRHLDQATYYENLGRGKIQDAIREYRCVLFLDPGNRTAQQQLKKLERELTSGAGAATADADRTLVLEPGQIEPALGLAPPTPTAPAAPPPKPASAGVPTPPQGVPVVRPPERSASPTPSQGVPVVRPPERSASPTPSQGVPVVKPPERSASPTPSQGMPIVKPPERSASPTPSQGVPVVKPPERSASPTPSQGVPVVIPPATAVAATASAGTPAPAAASPSPIAPKAPPQQAPSKAAPPRPAERSPSPRTERPRPAPAPAKAPPPRPAAGSDRLRTLLMAAAGLLVVLVVVGVVMMSRAGRDASKSDGGVVTTPGDVGVTPPAGAPETPDVPGGTSPPETAPTDAATTPVEPPTTAPPAASAPATPATLVLATTPSDARVRIDGRVQARRTNASYEGLAPGAHTIIVEKEGYRDARRTLTIKAGETRRLTMALSASATATGSPAATLPPPETNAPPPTAGNGTLVVRATPFASYFVDDDLKASNLPTAQIPLKAGEYRVRIVHPDFGAHTWNDVRIDGGRTTTLSYDFVSSSTGSVRVTSQGIWANVVVDGQPTPKTTPCVLELRRGSHTIELRRPGFTVEGGARTITVGTGTTMEVGFKMMKSER